MDLYQKISILGPSAQYDTCGPKDFGQTTNIPGVYHAKVGGNRVCRLFKVLQTNACQNNCRYCAFRRDRSCPRVSTTPEEMAKAFSQAHTRRLVDGLFLSSGIVANPTATMTKMLDTASILREKYRYSGYLHLKLMPGAPLDTIRESLRLANRVSLNIEAPTQESLKLLSPDKSLKIGFFHTLSLVKAELKKRHSKGQRSPSLTTQFVVGPGGESDQEIIKTSHFLYKNFGLYRIFFSAFRPVSQTPLSHHPAAPPLREHRLYQADFLLRQYRFTPRDLPFDSRGNLEEKADPKTLWAQKNPHFFPININKSSYWDLLKIPGIGPSSAKKIIQIRRLKRIQSLDALTNQRFRLSRASPYLSF